MMGGVRNWLILISAGLNLFLLGVLVPNFDRLLNPMPHRMPGPGMGPGGGPSPMGFMQEVSRRLSPEDADAFCKAMGNLPERFVAMEREWRGAMEESQKMLRDGAFDIDRFKATVTRGIVARTEFEERQRDDLAQAALAMSAEGRATLGTSPHRPDHGPGERGLGPGPGPGAMDRGEFHGPPGEGGRFNVRLACASTK
jgi:hypothetical protein